MLYVKLIRVFVLIILQDQGPILSSGDEELHTLGALRARKRMRGTTN